MNRFATHVTRAGLCAVVVPFFELSTEKLEGAQGRVGPEEKARVMLSPQHKQLDVPVDNKIASEQHLREWVHANKKR